MGPLAREKYDLFRVDLRDFGTSAATFLARLLIEGGKKRIADAVVNRFFFHRVQDRWNCMSFQRPPFRRLLMENSNVMLVAFAAVNLQLKSVHFCQSNAFFFFFFDGRCSR